MQNNMASEPLAVTSIKEGALRDGFMYDNRVFFSHQEIICYKYLQSIGIPGKKMHKEFRVGRKHFDFFPLNLGKVKDYVVKFHLYTVSGQIYYSSTRRLVMKGVDAVVFVADSQKDRFDANVEMIFDMQSHLDYYNIDFNKMPYVLQLNKRDLPDIVPAKLMVRHLRKKEEPVVEASALQGFGVIETLKSISKLIMTGMRDKIKY